VTLVSQFKERIEPRVTALGKLDEVMDLAELIDQGALPQRSPAGFVVPLGFDGRTPEDAAGLYVQKRVDGIAVVLVISAKGDPKAKRALEKIDELEPLVCHAVCGWVPEGASGDVNARRGRLVSVQNGVVIYQIDFEVQNQLRIAVA